MLSYQNVFITGGTSGLGSALAAEYLKRGCVVGITGRSVDKLAAEFKSNPKLIFYQVDVRDRSKMDEVIRGFDSQYPIDLVIANAGRSIPNKTRMPDFEIAREIIDINLIGFMNTLEPALKIFLKKQQGHFVGMASVAGLIGLPSAAAYSATKSGVLKICESLAIDMKSQNIFFTAIVPGFIDTPLTKQNHHKMPFLMSAPEAANKIIKAIDQKKGRFIFPWPMRIVMLFLELLPRSIYRKLMGLKFSNYSKAK